MSTDQPEQPTKCEWCGADYDPAVAPPAPARARQAVAGAATDEPVTHCEWCGAEYPTPERSPEA
jgi:hypothetical protein